MNKGVHMKKQIKGLLRFTLIGLIISIALSQSTGYLAQKLMLENNLRNRINDATNLPNLNIRPW